MRCYTFQHHQLLKYIEITKFTPEPGKSFNSKKKDSDVLFLGRYSIPGQKKSFAKNIELDYTSPAMVYEVPESKRIIENFEGNYEPSINPRKVCVIKNAVPWMIQKVYDGVCEGTKTVLKNPVRKNNLAVAIRINTSSSEDAVRRNGSWKILAGEFRSYSKTRSFTEKDVDGIKQVYTSSVDDLIVMYPGAIVVVSVEGTHPMDDQAITNIGGYLSMAPASTYTVDRSDWEDDTTVTAEEIEKSIEEAILNN